MSTSDPDVKRARCLQPIRVDPLTSLLHEVLMSSQNATTVEAAHALIRVVAGLSRHSVCSKPARVLGDILSKTGLEGIRKAPSFGVPQDQQREYGALIDKLVEVIYPACRPIYIWLLINTCCSSSFSETLTWNTSDREKSQDLICPIHRLD